MHAVAVYELMGSREIKSAGFFFYTGEAVRPNYNATRQLK
jgi:hypothetical protein